MSRLNKSHVIVGVVAFLLGITTIVVVSIYGFNTTDDLIRRICDTNHWNEWRDFRDQISDEIGEGDSVVNEQLILVIANRPRGTIRDHTALEMLEQNHPTIDQLRRALQANIDNRIDKCVSAEGSAEGKIQQAILLHDSCTFSDAWKYLKMRKERGGNYYYIVDCLNDKEIWNLLNSRYPDNLTTQNIALLYRDYLNDYNVPEMLVDTLISRNADDWMLNKLVEAHPKRIKCVEKLKDYLSR